MAEFCLFPVVRPMLNTEQVLDAVVYLWHRVDVCRRGDRGHTDTAPTASPGLLARPGPLALPCSLRSPGLRPQPAVPLTAATLLWRQKRDRSCLVPTQSLEVPTFPPGTLPVGLVTTEKDGVQSKNSPPPSEC